MVRLSRYLAAYRRIDQLILGREALFCKGPRVGRRDRQVSHPLDAEGNEGRADKVVEER
jgi:hypothetical protein